VAYLIVLIRQSARWLATYLNAGQVTRSFRKALLRHAVPPTHRRVDSVWVAWGDEWSDVHPCTGRKRHSR
jgi:hypothetical protein